MRRKKQWLRPSGSWWLQPVMRVGQRLPEMRVGSPPTPLPSRPGRGRRRILCWDLPECSHRAKLQVHSSFPGSSCRAGEGVQALTNSIQIGLYSKECHSVRKQILKYSRLGPFRPRALALPPAKRWQSLWAAPWGRTPGSPWRSSVAGAGSGQMCLPKQDAGGAARRRLQGQQEPSGLRTGN